MTKKNGLAYAKMGLICRLFMFYSVHTFSSLGAAVFFFFFMLQFFVWLEDAKSSALVDPSRNVDNNRSRALTTTQKPLVA